MKSTLTSIFFDKCSLFITSKRVKQLVVGLRLAWSFFFPSSAGVRGPASRGWIPSVEAPAEKVEEQRDVGRKGWRTECVPSGQVVLHGPAQRSPLGAWGRK